MNIETHAIISLWISVMGILSALSIALLTALNWSRWFFKPKFSAKLLPGCRQDEIGTIQRLAFTNEGNAIAGDVEVHVIRVIERFEEGDDFERENFVPAPLRWTHSHKPAISIKPQQTCILDLIEGNSYHHELAVAIKSGVGLKMYTLFDHNVFLPLKNTELLLRLYQEWAGNYEIMIELVYVASRVSVIASLKSLRPSQRFSLKGLVGNWFTRGVCFIGNYVRRVTARVKANR